MNTSAACQSYSGRCEKASDGPVAVPWVGELGVLDLAEQGHHRRLHTQSDKRNEHTDIRMDRLSTKSNL